MKVWVLITSDEREDVEMRCGVVQGVYESVDDVEQQLRFIAGEMLFDEKVGGSSEDLIYRIYHGWARAWLAPVEEVI